MKFHPVSGSLYVVDAYFGLAVVGSEGGQADVLTNDSEGVTHKFTNDLDIHRDGTVYFTVSSLRRPRRLAPTTRSCSRPAFYKENLMNSH
jgi:sugar lactone lactonase YvrE